MSINTGIYVLVGSIISNKNHNSILGDPQFIQFVEQTSHIIIQTMDHVRIKFIITMNNSGAFCTFWYRLIFTVRRGYKREMWQHRSIICHEWSSRLMLCGHKIYKIIHHHIGSIPVLNFLVNNFPITAEMRVMVPGGPFFIFSLDLPYHIGVKSKFMDLVIL